MRLIHVVSKVIIHHIKIVAEYLSIRCIPVHKERESDQGHVKDDDGEEEPAIKKKKTSEK